MSGSSRGGGCLLFVVIAVVVFIAFPMVFGNSNSGNSGGSTTNSTTQITANKPVDPDANLTPQTPPQNGAVLDGSEYGDAGVRVTAAPGANAYVKVKDMSGGTVVGFFVAAGSTAEVYVPEGTYNVQFAMGETWYGQSKRFGSRTSFGQDEGVSLGYGDVITYTLQMTTNGNFSMQSLDGSQF